jgi:hypothetical protein
MAKFKQSQNDFPCSVELGEKFPEWEISRWNTDGLRFVPDDEEDYSIRGDKRRLLYKGRRRSHRFTILNDCAFEYDCILKREPESNLITLRMEGAENFNFFKQPDFVSDPFLKGSYAVYKKETLLGDGTGKLCHINRPMIIDARERKCWGELSVVSDELRITIPQQWLSEAKYPVIVDPTIGTTTVGSQNKWIPPRYSSPTELYFEFGMPVNRFLINEAISGLCTAFYYSDYYDIDGGGRPIFYSDNANKPHTRRSSGENFIDLRFTGRWQSGTFTGDSINAGSYIWFGLFTEYFWFPRFDYGAVCYSSMWFDIYDSIPAAYPDLQYIIDFNLKLSMYFTYSNAQNYTRTLTQGISLTDTWKQKADYKRINTDVNKISDNRFLFTEYRRNVKETKGITDILKQVKVFFCMLYEECGNFAGSNKFVNYYRVEKDYVQADDSFLRQLFIFIKILTTSFFRDIIIRRFLIAKEEIALKSAITREIVLESKIN